MGKKSKKSVENCVVFDSSALPPEKKKQKYKKGKFPHTVVLIETGALFVRKAYRVNALKVDKETGEKIYYQKQKQVWRVCEPPTKERAAEVLQDILDDLADAQNALSRPLVIFADICKKFAETELVEARYSPTGQKIAGRRSLKGVNAMLESIIAFFGHRKIDSITFGDLQDFKNELIKTPVKFKYAESRPRSIRTVNYTLSFLRSIFYFAYRRRWLDRIPFLEGKRLIDKTAESRRDKTWTRNEEEAALALCTGKLAHMKAVIICCVDGGFRRSELFNSLWRETNFEIGEMIARSYKGKTLHTRTVYMTKRMMEVLIEWKGKQKKVKNIADHSLVIGYSDVTSSWETIRAKIGRPDLRLHDLRHVFGTRLDQSKKVSLKEIQLLLGHSDIKTTQIYLNPTVENLRESIKVLEIK